MMDLQDKHNLSYLLVSHDLTVVNLMCDEVLVLQDGCMVEYGSTEELFKYPQHPCTKSLLAAIPGIDSQAI
jgi:ABC-type oligopeptide transport system ATPase subunit